MRQEQQGTATVVASRSEELPVVRLEIQMNRSPIDAACFLLASRMRSNYGIPQIPQPETRT